MENISILLTFCIFLSSAGFIAAGAYVILRARKLKQYGLTREALVVKFGDKTPPVLEYMTACGIHRVKSRFSGIRFFFPFNEGETVRIFYDQNNFKRFHIEGDRVPAFLAGLMIIMGIITLQLIITFNITGFKPF